MMLGILPALLILYVRRNVEDPEVFSETKKKEKATTARPSRRTRPSRR